jgi:hypothetical protein
MKAKSQFSFSLISIIAKDGKPIEVLEVQDPKHEGDPDKCICCGKRIDEKKATPVIIGNLGRLTLIPWGEEARVENLGCYFFGNACAKKIPAHFKGEAGLFA